MNMVLSLYNDKILSLKRGTENGKRSISKPIFLLSIIDGIKLQKVDRNCLAYNCEFLRKSFGLYYEIYNGNRKGFEYSFFLRPFFYLSTSDFYHLIWKEGVTPPSMASTPSAKYLRENLLYAKLDDELWELLQDSDNREYLRTKIIKNYLTKE